MKTRIIAITVAVIAMTAFSADSQAGDFKSYNGGMCQVANNALIQQSGWAYNSSTSTTLTVDCPTVRDLSSSAVLAVFAIDRHFYDNVSCYGSSLVIGSNTPPWLGWWTATASSSGTNSNMQELNLGSISGSSTSLLFITCDIPPQYYSSKSGIFGYNVYES